MQQEAEKFSKFKISTNCNNKKEDFHTPNLTPSQNQKPNKNFETN
jgi:hypothetical protein